MGSSLDQGFPKNTASSCASGSSHEKGRWLSRSQLAALSVLLLLVLIYWTLPLLLGYWVPWVTVPRVLAAFFYFEHWGALGAILGFFVSGKRVRGAGWGAAIGIILARLL